MKNSPWWSKSGHKAYRYENALQSTYLCQMEYATEEDRTFLCFTNYKQVASACLCSTSKRKLKIVFNILEWQPRSSDTRNISGGEFSYLSAGD